MKILSEKLAWSTVAKWCFWQWDGCLSTSIKDRQFTGLFCFGRGWFECNSDGKRPVETSESFLKPKLQNGGGEIWKRRPRIHRERYFHRRRATKQPRLYHYHVVDNRLSNLFWAGGAVIVAKTNQRSSEMYLPKKEGLIAAKYGWMNTFDGHKTTQGFYIHINEDGGIVLWS